MIRRAAVWLSLLLLGLVVLGLFLVPRGNSTPQPVLAGTLMHEKRAPDVQLTDQFHHRISLAAYRGRPVVLTFLESHCRATCPLIAEKLREAVRGLGPAGQRVAVLVVSVDPEGDTIAAVRRFSRAHDMLHRWHYLVGNRRTLARVWRAYYIYAAPKNASAALAQGHTSAMYLIDRQGRERVLLTGNPDEVALSQDLHILAGVAMAPPAEAAPAPASGHPAPDILLRTLAGRSMHLRSLRGRVVLLNFWATWCTACRSEMPRLVTWSHQLHRRGFVVLGVDQQEDPAAVAAFTHRYHIRYPILLDSSGDVSARYNVVGMPTSFLIDRQGIIQSVHIGVVNSAYRWQKIAPLLSERAHD